MNQHLNQIGEIEELADQFGSADLPADRMRQEQEHEHEHTRSDLRTRISGSGCFSFRDHRNFPTGSEYRPHDIDRSVCGQIQENFETRCAWLRRGDAALSRDQSKRAGLDNTIVTLGEDYGRG